MIGIIVIAGLCVLAPISAQQANSLPINCVLNEKRANPNNPHTFYFCRADGPTLVKCPDNMVFDISAKDCVKQGAVAQPMNNVSVAKLPLITGGWQGPPPAGWTPPPPPPPPPTTAAPSGPTTPTPTPPTSCPAQDGENPTYLPNPEDCTQFWECSNGTPYLFNCPAGLVFDIILDVCNYPFVATTGCGVLRSKDKKKLL